MLQAHGTYNITRKGDILIVSTKGPFNTLSTKMFTKDMEEHIKAMPEKWGQVITADKNDLFTPEVEEYLNQACLKRKQQGCYICGLVFAEDVGASRFIIEAQTARIYEYAGIKYLSFDDHQLAEQWVLDQLTLL